MEQKTKTIIGRVGDIVRTRTIEYYQPNIHEQELTEKRKIIREFEDLGYSEKDVVFDK